MNPLDWPREHQVAGFVFCLIGGIVGMTFGWLESSLHQASVHSVSGPLSNTAAVFLMWLPALRLYWHWPVIGALLAGMTFYAIYLLKL